MTSPSNPPRVPMLNQDAAADAVESRRLPREIAASTIMRTLFRCPRPAADVQKLILHLLDGGLPRRLVELVILRIGWATNCDYEWTRHWHMALELGIPEEDLAAVRFDWRDHVRFSAEERAALAATDDMVATGAIGDGAWTACTAAFGSDESVVELVLVIANWLMISNILRSLHIQLEEGTASWPPDGIAPASLL